MTFAFPVALVALIAIPLLVRWYGREQRRRARAAEAFAAPALLPSVAPTRPAWRRHLPMVFLLVAAIALIVAAARPQRVVAVPLQDGAIMLMDDVSSSMLAGDVRPSRLQAARQAETKFLTHVPSTIQVGLLEFARRPTLLQSPSADHGLVAAALSQLGTGGGTAMGDAILASLHSLAVTRAPDGRRPPGAIVLLSDGASNVGSSPLSAARQAAASHVPVYTVSVGTPYGRIPIRRRGRTVLTPVPVSSQELAEVARLSRARTFTAGDAGGLSTVYEHLAANLGQRRVTREETRAFVGGGLALLAVGLGLSLLWFGRLI